MLAPPCGNCCPVACSGIDPSRKKNPCTGASHGTEPDRRSGFRSGIIPGSDDDGVRPPSRAWTSRGAVDHSKPLMKIVSCENSEVLPNWSVAVAVISRPPATETGSVAENATAPFASVLALKKPRYCWPSA